MPHLQPHTQIKHYLKQYSSSRAYVYTPSFCISVAHGNIAPCRLCSNIVFILGTVAEDQAVAVTLVELAEASQDWNLLARLGSMLLSDDTEAVINSAGALGTLVSLLLIISWDLPYCLISWDLPYCFTSTVAIHWRKLVA